MAQRPIHITVTHVKARLSQDTEFPFVLHYVVVEDEKGEWKEMFQTEAELRAFERGMKAAVSFFGVWDLPVVHKHVEAP